MQVYSFSTKKVPKHCLVASQRAIQNNPNEKLINHIICFLQLTTNLIANSVPNDEKKKISSYFIMYKKTHHNKNYENQKIHPSRYSFEINNLLILI